MPHSSKLVVLLDELIDEGQKLLQTVNRHALVEETPCRLWANKLILFRSLAGDIVAPWKQVITRDTVALTENSVSIPLAGLQTIRYAINKDLLVRYEDLVFAEAFADLFEQGTYLREQGFFVAAGVLFRAILEERLRILCQRNGCVPMKDRPTINDYNQSLYKCTPPVFDKIMLHHVTSLAAIGNDAAHNKSTLSDADVQILERGLKDFLARFSV
jgi:hypothetical protein